MQSNHHNRFLSLECWVYEQWAPRKTYRDGSPLIPGDSSFGHRGINYDKRSLSNHYHPLSLTPLITSLSLCNAVNLVFALRGPETPSSLHPRRSREKPVITSIWNPPVPSVAPLHFSIYYLSNTATSQLVMYLKEKRVLGSCSFSSVPSLLLRKSQRTVEFSWKTMLLQTSFFPYLFATYQG